VRPYSSMAIIEYGQPGIDLPGPVHTNPTAYARNSGHVLRLHALRELIVTASDPVGIDPRRISFTHALCTAGPH
jgi:hypothetical protein